MADAINAVYESLGGLFIAASILRILKDRQCKGVSMFHVLFFWSWGFWNLWFYPAVGAWYSFYGGIGIVITNSIWLCLILYFRASPDRTARAWEILDRSQRYHPGMDVRPEYWDRCQWCGEIEHAEDCNMRLIKQGLGL